MKLRKGDIISVRYELLEDYDGPDDRWMLASYRRVGGIKIEERALDLNKPVRFIAPVRKDQKIYYVGPSAFPHTNSLVVEYVDEAGMLRAEHFVSSQLENIPQDEL